VKGSAFDKANNSGLSVRWLRMLALPGPATIELGVAELAEYSHKKGLYAEQVTVWRDLFMQANATVAEQTTVSTDQARSAKKEIKQPKRLIRLAGQEVPGTGIYRIESS
jgi:hypothetical protein